jgi:DNA-binding transcriptional MerR regulator
MSMTSTYGIAELAADFDVTPRTLRFYESKGILRPFRRGTTRLYSERDRTRLKLALRGKRLGFSLEECRDIIDLYDPSGANNAAQLIRLLAKIREHRGDLITKLNDIEETLSAMDEVEAQCLADLQRTASDSSRRALN